MLNSKPPHLFLFHPHHFSTPHPLPLLLTLSPPCQPYLVHHFTFFSSPLVNPPFTNHFLSPLPHSTSFFNVVTLFWCEESSDGEGKARRKKERTRLEKRIEWWRKDDGRNNGEKMMDKEKKVETVKEECGDGVVKREQGGKGEDMIGGKNVGIEG